MHKYLPEILSLEIVSDKILVTVHQNTWDDSRITLQLME